MKIVKQQLIENTFEGVNLTLKFYKELELVVKKILDQSNYDNSTQLIYSSIHNGKFSFFNEPFKYLFEDLRYCISAGQMTVEEFNDEEPNLDEMIMAIQLE